MVDSGTSTPRFTSQGTTAEDLLKSQTVGLVQLDEFRKRRRDVEELKQREARGVESDGALTPRTEASRAGTPTTAEGSGFKKKKRKIASKGLLSFGGDEEEEIDGISGGGSRSGTSTPALKVATPTTTTTLPENSTEASTATSEPARRKLMSNPNAGLPAPKVMTKAALSAEVVERERLRKEFLEVQERVRNTEIAVPFVFHDGTSMPGGTVRIKKGDHIWLFLERCRKVGAELAMGGTRRGNGSADNSGGMKTRVEGRKSWARIGVDDLLCVRGNVIIPHHYEFYYFIANKVQDPKVPGQMLFDYAGTAPPKPNEDEQVLIRNPKDEVLEGQNDDPTYTKVVDRRWYERNKHIYPASLWKEYKAGKEFEELAKGRKDAQGNSFFYF